MKKQISQKMKKITKLLLFVFLVAVLTLTVAFYFYAKDYSNKVLPNYFFLDEKMAGSNKDGVEGKLDELQKSYKDHKIKLVKDDKSWEISLEGLGWKFDKEKLTDEIYTPGHRDKFYKNILAMAAALVSNSRIKVEYSFNEKLAEDWLNQISSEVATPKQEANIMVKGGKAKIIEPKSGKDFDEINVKKEILERLSLRKTGDIKIELTDDQPIISKDEAAALSDKAVELTSREVELAGPKGSVKWGVSTLGALIELKKNIVEQKSFLKKETYGAAYVSFSKSDISDLLEKQSSDLNIEPVDARFQLDNGKVTLNQASKDGQIIDLDASSNKIVESLEQGKDGKIELPSKVQLATISAQDASDIEKFGIKELIGTGTTDFSKSPDNRVHNIQTGVKALSGALIKPGDEFSTIGHLGKIDAASGYLQELVIKGNETKPEFGGGLCQVSTTLFRSAMNTGLKITERQNHSYRVSYYEPPVGMDATIYYPKPDLKFVNDTPSYILIQGRVDGSKITFDFYGTKDGRTVETTAPEIYDVTPPPPDIYIDDPSLAPGEVKRIDRAHNGAKAKFYYRVTKNGKITEKEFKSEYVPWAAKYLRGPGVDEGQQPSQ